MFLRLSIRMPLFSVVIPLFNKEKYIERCLDSVLVYNSQEIEVIVVDDGSRDNSVSIVNSYIKKDSRVQLFLHDVNKGTYLARQTGVEMSSGDYIFFLDPDDWMDTLCFDLAARYINKVDIIVFNTTCVFKDKKQFWGNTGNVFLMGEDILSSYTRVENQNWGVYPKLIKRDLVLKALSNLSVREHLYISEDILLFFTCCLFAKTLQRIDFIAYYYCFVDEESVTRTPITLQKILKDLKQTKYILDLLEKVLQRYDFDLSHLRNTKKELFHYFHARLYELKDCSSFDIDIVRTAIIETVGGLSCYYALLGSGSFHCSTHPKFNKMYHLITKILPYGSFRRFIVKQVLKSIFNVLKPFYKLIMKVSKE